MQKVFTKFFTALNQTRPKPAARAQVKSPVPTHRQSYEPVTVRGDVCICINAMYGKYHQTRLMAPPSEAERKEGPGAAPGDR